MDTEHQKWVLIQRYITGHANDLERKEIEVWMAKSHQNRKLVQDLRYLWDQTLPEEFDVDVEKAWDRFRYQTHQKKRQKDTQPASPAYTARRGVGRYWINVAAILFLAALLGLFAYSQFGKTDVQPGLANAEPWNSLEEIGTERGEKVSVTFSDGTSVMVNSASSIRFPKVFHEAKREIYLEGEAYFEVAHNPDQPFIVHVQDAEIEVLGTEFNVRGWSQDPGVEVVVSDGSVSVRSVTKEVDSGSGVVLTEGLKTVVARGQAPEQPHEVQALRYMLWTSGGIHFDSTPFHQVVRDIERQYDVEVTVSVPSLLQIPYTGTFQHVELNEILEVIATTMEVGFRRDGSEIEFYQ